MSHRGTDVPPLAARGSAHYALARQTANARTMIGTSASHAAPSTIIDSASIGRLSHTASICARHGGTEDSEETAALFKQPVVLNPHAGVGFRREASRCPDHCTELAQRYAVTTILPDKDVVDWLCHALHMAWRRARYMRGLHKLSCSTDGWSRSILVRRDCRHETVEPTLPSANRRNLY